MNKHRAGTGDPWWWTVFKIVCAAVAVLMIMHAFKLLPWQD